VVGERLHDTEQLASRRETRLVAGHRPLDHARVAVDVGEVDVQLLAVAREGEPQHALLVAVGDVGGEVEHGRLDVAVRDDHDLAGLLRDVHPAVAGDGRNGEPEPPDEECGMCTVLM
jgi:hypothetical protein